MTGRTDSSERGKPAQGELWLQKAECERSPTDRWLRATYGRPPLKITWDGKELLASGFRTQAVGDDVLVWIGRRLEKETSLEVSAQ